MKFALVLLLAAALAALAGWVVVEHAKTRREIERLERDLRELRQPSSGRWRADDPSSIGAEGRATGAWL